VLAEAGDGEETLVVDLDLAAIEAWRKDFPVNSDRRLDTPDKIDTPDKRRQMSHE
jgi:predicted amidohydrolase